MKRFLLLFVLLLGVLDAQYYPPSGGGGGGSVNSVTATAPITSSGGANPNVSATYQGNGLKVQASTGTTTTNDCVKFDVNGNTVDAGAACNSVVVPTATCAGSISVQTLSYTGLSGDSGKVTPMNGSGLTYTVFGSPTSGYTGCVTNLNSSPLTIANNGFTFNGVSSQTYSISQYQTFVYWYSSGTNYYAGVVSSGSVNGQNGFTFFSGGTSGGSGFGVANVAGSQTLYIMPTTPGTSGQLMEDTGSVTCPTELPASAPSSCHQLSWQTVASGGMTQLAQITVTGSAATTETFSSISSSYSGLLLQIYGHCTSTGIADDNMYIQFNSDVAANYGYASFFFQNGSTSGPTAGSTATATPAIANLGCTGNNSGTQASTVSIWIPGYAFTSFQHGGQATSQIYATQGPLAIGLNGVFNWNNTSAINTITLGLVTGGDQFAIGTRFTLYGLL